MGKDDDHSSAIKEGRRRDGDGYEISSPTAKLINYLEPSSVEAHSHESPEQSAQIVKSMEEAVLPSNTSQVSSILKPVTSPARAGMSPQKPSCDGCETPDKSGVHTAKLNNKPSTMEAEHSNKYTGKSAQVSSKEETVIPSNLPKTFTSPARAVLSSQKDLRQQFRKLQSQELIRRILQSTGVVPKDLAQHSPNFECSSQAETVEKVAIPSLELGTDQSANQVPIETKTISGPVKLDPLLSDQIKPEGVSGDGGKSPPSGTVNPSEATEKSDSQKNMESDTSFVCSMCSAKHEEHMPVSKHAELMNSSVESCTSLSLAKYEEEKEDLGNDEASFESNTAGQHQTAVGKVQRNSSVEELSERLQKQPNHETLDEILRLLQNQAKALPVDKKQENQSLQQQTNYKGPFESMIMEETKEDIAWKQEQQQKFLMMGARPNLREKHSRQLADMKNYYESEIGKLRDQLDGLRGNLVNLQEAIPVKLLEATNHKLEARCNVMEGIAGELKEKCQKFEHHNAELGKSCIDLRQTNEALEMRCIFLQKAVQELEQEQSEIQNSNKLLEAKVSHLTQTNEVGAKTCKQLEDSNKTFENACMQLEESKQRLEARYRKCKEENIKLSEEIRDIQASLQASRKYAKEHETTVISLQNEKEDWGLKLDAAQKMAKAAQIRYEEVRLERNDKESMVKKFEEQMSILTVSFENAAKAKDELEKNAERDKELLKRLLTEYDTLARENQQLKASAGSVADKLDISQDEINGLRGTVTKLIHRNNNLEESLKDALSRSFKTTTDSLSPSVRKTWDSPTPLKAEKNHQTSQSSLTSFESIFDGREGRGPMTSSPARPEYTPSGATNVSTVEKETPQKQLSPFGTSSIKFEIPWENPKSTPTKHSAKRNLERNYLSSPDKAVPTSTKSPQNLKVKKSDLVTRFDVVFEDSASGKEVKRSHTGRTSRAFGESPTSLFISNSSSSDMTDSSTNRVVSSAAEAALTALRSGRVVSQAEWENKDTMSKSAKGRKERGSHVKKMGRQVQTETRENGQSQDQENVVPKLERKFSSLSEERKRLESTLSRIPAHRVTKRSLDDKAFLEKRLDEVIQDVGSVRMELRRHHAL